MKKIYLDLKSGISGNMFVGAMIDLGMDFEEFKKQVSKLKLDEKIELRSEKVIRRGISATYFSPAVQSEAEEGIWLDSENGMNCEREHHHDHEHTHEHEHYHKHDHEHRHAHEHKHEHTHEHRNFRQIKHMIESSDLSNFVKKNSIEIFERIARAESAVHGVDISELHFHEVGATDSIVDVVGSAVAMELMGVEKITASSLSVGTGYVKCAHGIMGVPVPATVRIACEAGIPLVGTPIEAELSTPTGTAILAQFAEEYKKFPEMVIKYIGYGAGKRDNEIPNVVTAYVYE